MILSPKRGLPMVSVNLWYHVGPANEAAGRTGFAHLFEHMMFQSSKHVPEDQYIRDDPGRRRERRERDDQLRPYTNYYSTVPANQVELVLWLESDRMGYLLDKLDEAALANQQDVVRNERRQSREGPPYGMAEETVYQTLFPKGHPYYGVIIGSHEDIQAAKLDDVRRFFREFYAPNNATIALVGDFEPAQIKPLIAKYFGTFRRGPAVTPLKVETPRITAERRKVVQARVQLPKVYMAWLTPAAVQAGRRRGGLHRADSRRGPIEPAVQEARLRTADCAGRERRPVVAPAHLDIRDRGDRAPRAHGRGAGESD